MTSDNVEMVNLNVRVPRRLYRAAKLAALREERRLRLWVREALEAALGAVERPKRCGTV